MRLMVDSDSIGVDKIGLDSIKASHMEKPTVVIRKMKLSDFSEVISIWEKSGLQLADTNVELAEFKKILRLNPLSCFVIIRDKKIIGGALGTFNGRRGWIYHLGIDPQFQKLGYGALLLGKIEKALKKRGATRVHLSVLANNLKVMQFYKKYKYSVVDDALWLGKDI